MTGPIDDPRVFLAEERTLLAWIRTGPALMGFGFVVARFGLLLRSSRSHPPWQSRRTGCSLRRSAPGWESPSWLGLAVAALLAVAGAVMALHLLTEGGMQPTGKAAPASAR